LAAALLGLAQAQAQPTLLSSVPDSGATGVAPNASVAFTFSEAMDTNQTTAQFMEALNPLAGYLNATETWSADCQTLTCSPTPPWPPGQMIAWGVTGADQSGNALPDDTSGLFSTGQQAPSFTVVPADKAVGVSPGAPVVFTFAVAMNTNATEALLYGTLPPVLPLPMIETWSADHTILTCQPSPAFPTNKSILWSVAGADTVGNTLPETEGTFVTASALATAEVVSRGEWVQQTASNVLQTFAQEFVALASATLTNGVTVTAPAPGQANLLKNTGWPDALEFEDSRSTASSFAAIYPAGNYLLTVSSPTAPQKATLSLADGALPSAPHFLNWQNTTNVILGQSYPLQWDFATGGAAVDYLRLEVQQNGKVVFATPLPGGAGALTGASNLVTVPAGAFTSAGPALIRLMAFSWTASDTNSIAGATVHSARHRTTTFAAQVVQGSAPVGVAQVYGIFQGQEFQQTGPTLSPLAPAYWESWVRGLPSGQLDAVGALTPKGAAWSLTLDDKGASLRQDYTSSAARAADFPAGQYSLDITNADGSSYQVALTQLAADYPATPALSAAVGAAPIRPGTDLALVWQPDPNARLQDYQRLTVMNPNSSLPLLSTPWPGQPGALSGLVTNMTVPGNLLHSGDLLLVTLTRYRIASSQSTPDGKGLALAGSAASILTSLSVANPSQNTNDIAEYRVLAGEVFLQNGDSPPLAATNGGFVFEESVWSNGQVDLTNVVITPPGGAPMALPNIEAYDLWQTNRTFDHEADLWAALPAGAYQWTFYGTLNGRQTATNTLAAGAWPLPLTVANWTDLQTQSFTNDVSILWTLPAGASADDQIELLIVNAEQAVVCRFPDYTGGNSAIPGTNTSYSIAADTMFDGEVYEARLRYISVSQEDTQTLSGATGLAGRYAETRFALGTQMHAVLRITRFSRLPGQVLEMGLTAQPNEVVTVQSSPDLKQWQTVLSTNLPPNGLFTWTNSQTRAASFFRACRGSP